MKLSKLALMPLLALLLVSCNTQAGSGGSAGTTDGSTSSSETVTQGWSEEETTLIKTALNGNTLPYFHYENGEFETSVEEGITKLSYTVVEPEEGAKTELITKFEADGYVLNEQATSEKSIVYNKPLERYYLSEQIIMEIYEGKTPLRKPYLGLSWMYICDEQVKEWPTAKLTEQLGVLGCIAPLPAPSFEFTHFTLLDADLDLGMLVYGLFKGQNALPYVKDLILNGYTVEGGYLDKEQTTPIYNAFNDLYKHNVLIYDDAELQATIIAVSYMPTTHWYNTFLMMQVKEILGIDGLYFPQPSFALEDVVILPTPVDETNPESDLILNVIVMTENAKSPIIYLTDLLTAGGFVVLEYPTKPGAPLVLIDGATKAVVTLSGYVSDAGGFLIQIVGLGGKATAEDAASYVGSINEAIVEAFGETAVVPTLPVADLYGTSALPVGNKILVKAIYADPLATAKAYVALFTEAAGWKVSGEVKADSVVVLANKELNLSINLLVDSESSTILMAIGVYPAPDNWKETLGEEGYAILTGILGENADKILPMPNYRTLLSADGESAIGYVGSVKSKTISITFGSAATLDPMTQADYIAYSAALVKAGWTLAEDLGQTALYTKTIAGQEYSLMVSFNDAAFDTTGLFIVAIDVAAE